MSKSQNTSSAVMQQRNSPIDSLDDFPTPPWATRALCESLAIHSELRTESVLDPAANRGYMTAPLSEYFRIVTGSDVHDYGVWFPVVDYLDGSYPENGYGWVITNPPFNLAEKFIEESIRVARNGVAMLTRTSFLESVGRYDRLFTKTPPTTILQFTERVPMHRSRITKKGATATSYCWLVWKFPDLNDGAVSFSGVNFEWIPPCRKRLELPNDYDLRGNWPD